MRSCVKGSRGAGTQEVDGMTGAIRTSGQAGFGGRLPLERVGSGPAGKDLWMSHRRWRHGGRQEQHLGWEEAPGESHKVWPLSLNAAAHLLIPSGNGLHFSKSWSPSSVRLGPPGGRMGLALSPSPSSGRTVVSFT